MMSAPARENSGRDLHCVAGCDAVIAHPVVGGDAHRHRLVGGPHGTHRGEHLQREAHAVLERAAVLVGALVRHRRDERRDQVAVRGVQFDHVEPGPLGHLRRRHELRPAPRPCRLDPSPSEPRSMPTTGWPRRTSPASCRRPADGRSPPSRVACCPCDRSGRSGSRSWPRSRRARTRVSRCHAASCSGAYNPVHPGVMRPSGETHVISV